MNRSIFDAVLALVALVGPLFVLPLPFLADHTDKPDSSPVRFGHLRVARPTDHMEEIVRFHRDGLGLEVIASFEDHDGYRVVLHNAAWE